MLGSKILKGLENDSFAVSFMYLGLRSECREDNTTEEKASQRLDYRVVVNKMVGSLQNAKFQTGLKKRHFKGGT